MHRDWLCAALMGLFLCGILAGCNVFEGIGDGEDGKDAQVLLHDARTALDRGEPEVAVDYLEQAFEIDPANPEIRIALVGARYAAADVDLITLKGLIEHINGGGGAQAAGASMQRAKAEGGYCTFDADPAELEPFDYTSAPEYQQFRAEIETFLTAHDLLNGIRPADREALSDAVRAEWYLLRAFTRIVLAIDAINAEVEQVDATLYRLSGLENSIGICAASKSALDRAEARIKCDHLPLILMGLDELRIRSELLDDAEVSGVIADLERAVDVVGAQLSSTVIRFCSASAGR